MTRSAVVVLLATFAGWYYVFGLPRPGIWRRSWLTASVLVAISAGSLWRAGELADAVGGITANAVLAGVSVGVVWVVATQIGHAVLCRILPSFVDRVRDLYSIAAGDRRRDVLIALVGMAVAEEFVFRLVVQREFGITAAVIAYTAVQAMTRNWALMLAGAACGLVWGVLYAWQPDLVAPLIAHVIWTATLVFVWPLSGCGATAIPESDAVAISEID